MSIHTSRIFYYRGITKKYSNFAFVTQTNNTIPVPISKYLKNYNFYNRNKKINVSGFQTFPWNNN